MSHYSYLGSAAPLSFVRTPTKEGDNFATFFQVYAAAFPEGAPERTSAQAFAQAICSANGVPYNTSAVESWIFSVSGKRRAFNPSNNPGMHRGPKGVGWAYFAEGNLINLPDFPRAGLPSKDLAPGTQPGGQEDEGQQAWWMSPWVIGGVAAAALIVVSALPKKKEKKSASRERPTITKWSTVATA